MRIQKSVIHGLPSVFFNFAVAVWLSFTLWIISCIERWAKDQIKLLHRQTLIWSKTFFFGCTKSENSHMSVQIVGWCFNKCPTFTFIFTFTFPFKVPICLSEYVGLCPLSSVIVYIYLFTKCTHTHIFSSYVRKKENCALICIVILKSLQ